MPAARSGSALLSAAIEGAERSALAYRARAHALRQALIARMSARISRFQLALLRRAAVDESRTAPARAMLDVARARVAASDAWRADRSARVRRIAACVVDDVLRLEMAGEARAMLVDAVVAQLQHAPGLTDRELFREALRITMDAAQRLQAWQAELLPQFLADEPSLRLRTAAASASDRVAADSSAAPRDRSRRKRSAAERREALRAALEAEAPIAPEALASMRSEIDRVLRREFVRLVARFLPASIAQSPRFVSYVMEAAGPFVDAVLTTLASKERYLRRLPQRLLHTTALRLLRSLGLASTSFGASLASALNPDGYGGWSSPFGLGAGIGAGTGALPPLLLVQVVQYAVRTAVRRVLNVGFHFGDELTRFFLPGAAERERDGYPY